MNRKSVVVVLLIWACFILPLQPMLHSSSSDPVLFHDGISMSTTTSGPQTPLHHLPVSLPLTQGEAVLPPATTPPSPKPSADKLLIEPLSPSVSADAEVSTSSSPRAVVIKQEIQHEDVTDDEAPVKTSTPSPPVASGTAMNGLKPGLEDITDDEADVKPDLVEVKIEVKEEIESPRDGRSSKIKTEPCDPSDGSSFLDVKEEIKEEDGSANNNKSSVSDEDANKSSDVSRTSLLEEEGGRKGNGC